MIVFFLIKFKIVISEIFDELSTTRIFIKRFRNYFFVFFTEIFENIYCIFFYAIKIKFLVVSRSHLKYGVMILLARVGPLICILRPCAKSLENMVWWSLLFVVWGICLIQHYLKKRWNKRLDVYFGLFLVPAFWYFC